MRQVGDRDDTALGDGDGQDVHATLGDGDGQDAAKEPLDAQALVDLAGGGPSAGPRGRAFKAARSRTEEVATSRIGGGEFGGLYDIG